MKPMFSRGPTLRFRLFLAIISAISIIFSDSRIELFMKIRSFMDTAISPFYFLVNSSYQIVNSVVEILSSYQRLKQESKYLRYELLLKNSELMMLEQFRQENIRLRNLLKLPIYHNEKKMMTQVISINTDPYIDQMVIDKGKNHGVYEGQPVISDQGVVGQVIAVGYVTSRVLLICDISHALPVQVLRNDMRFIVSGRGCKEDLQFEYPSNHIDIRVGDVLVSSGLGGRFPEGYPVAEVSSVKFDKQHSSTIIRAHPTANLQCLRYLLLLGINHQEDHLISPDEVHIVASNRLMKIRSKNLSPSGIMNPIAKESNVSLIPKEDLDIR